MAAVGYKTLAVNHGITEEQAMQLVLKMPKRKIGYVRLEQVGSITTKRGKVIPLHAFIAEENAYADELGSLSGNVQSSHAKAETKKLKKKLEEENSGELTIDMTEEEEVTAGN